MKTITQIVKLAGGYEQLREGSLRLKNPPFMDLILDLVYSPDRTLLRMGHYGIQNGDLMADPEMVIEILPDDQFNPLSYRNDYAGYYREVDESTDDRANQKLKRELYQFLRVWDRNLLDQGFLDAMSKPDPEDPQCLKPEPAMSKFKSASGGMMLGRGLTADAVQALAEKFKSPQNEREFRDRALFVFMTRTALRAHELVSLKWSAVIQTPEGDEVFQYRKKGGRDAFTAPGKKAIKVVREYHEAFGIQSDFLFVSLPGRNRRERHGLTTRSLQKIVNAWNVKTSSGKMIHPHALRHTAAQRAFDKAGSLAAQKLCGHSSPAITSAFYTRPYLSNVEELLDW